METINKILILGAIAMLFVGLPIGYVVQHRWEQRRKR